MIGQTIAHYRITEKLGEGGMGEVYRAHDTKLNREVALKILPEVFAQDSERMARFEREAQVLASLNHSNIAQIHGLEETDGTKALVLELVEGETLAEQIARGPIPVDEVLKIASQICGGLEAAHEKGIIHRDLKPANVMVSPESQVKILDFGLAKALEGETPVSDLSHSPTLTEEMTRAGVILGTASYMSPEQARGKPVDKRTDIWAFGCVLYEMLTGKKAFGGDASDETVSDVLAAVLKSEPDWEALPISLPFNLRRLLKRTLSKELKSRTRDIGDAALEIASAPEGEVGIAPDTVGRSIPSWKTFLGRLMWLCGGALIVTLIWAARPELPPPSPMHLPIATPPDVILDQYSHFPSVTISPDGTKLAYVGSSEGQSRLYLQDLDKSGGPTPIPGTEMARSPSFSPDGRWVAFAADNWLKKVALGGGDPIELAEVPFINCCSWSPNQDTIYYVKGLAAGIWRVPSDGDGEAQAVTIPRKDGFDNNHWWPQVLPDGEKLLYTSCCGDERVMVLDLKTGLPTELINGFHATFVPPNYVLFVQGNSLMAAYFDPVDLRVGHPESVLEDVVIASERHAEYAVSQNGTLCYLSGPSELERILVKVDRTGRTQRLDDRPLPYSLTMDIDPDGKRVALTLWEDQQDVFIYDLDRGDFDRFTLDPHNDFAPLWMPDGSNLIFSSVRKGNIDLYMKPSDRSGGSRPYLINDYPKWACSWSPDGELAYEQEHPENGRDIWILSPSDQDNPKLFLGDPFNEERPAFSPDGRWLAYASDELGQPEIYVAPYPGPGARCKVSTSGGREPRWSTDGKELFYRQDDKAMVVDVTDRDFCSAKPRVLFQGLNKMMWDVSPDGDFFITIEQPEAAHLHLVQNFHEELKHLVPTDN